MSQAIGTGSVLAPPELVEVGLMERFHWTPDQIDKVPFGKLQRIFIVLQQKEISQDAADKMKQEKQNQLNKSREPKGPLR